MKTFHLQIVTPDGLYFDGEAEKLIVRASTGDVCILPRHADYVTALGMGQARITTDGDVRKAACIGGMLSVVGNEVRLLPTTFEWADKIDKDRAIKAKEKAEKRLETAKDRHEQDILEAKLKRALVRVSVYDNR